MSDPTDGSPKIQPVRPAPPPKRHAPGDLCPHCGFAALRAEAKGHVRCPVCGFSTAPPCT